MGSKAYGDVVVVDDGGDGGKSKHDGGWSGTHRNIDGTDDDAGGWRGSASEVAETSIRGEGGGNDEDDDATMTSPRRGRRRRSMDERHRRPHPHPRYGHHKY